MEKLLDFLDKNMNSAVLVTIISSLSQVFFHSNTAQMQDEIIRQIMVSTSGIQTVMLFILYLFLKARSK